MQLEEFVENYINEFEEKTKDSKSTLDFTLHDTSSDERETPLLGAKHYPFLHAKLEVPTDELATIVQKNFGINFYELSLHVNTFTDMHNAYCSLIENSFLVEHFVKQGKGTVKIENDEKEFISYLKKQGIIPEMDGVVSVSSIFSSGIIAKKDNKGNLIPLRYYDIQSSKFFNWLYQQQEIIMLNNDSDDFWYILGDNENPQRELRKYTIKLFTHLLNEQHNKEKAEKS